MPANARSLQSWPLLGSVLVVALVFAVVPHAPSVWAQAAEGPLTLDETATPVVEGLNGPANFAFAPDGSIWIAEAYTGRVLVHDPARDETREVLTVPLETDQDERGLTGLALAPDFETTGTFYLYYTAPSDEAEHGVNKLVRVTDGDQTTILTVPAAPIHNGGRILFTPNNTLFIGTGENELRDPAQDLDSLLGKILHITPDGEPVEGNVRGLVYSYGHRNVFGLAWDAENDVLWSTENSGWRRDEVNRIEPGGNYGYPECEGRGLNGVDDPCPTDKGYIFPVMSFYEDRAAAPTGATFWQGDLYWGSLRDLAVHRLTFDEERQEWNDTIVHEAEGMVLDVRVGPDGDLYYSTFEGIYQIDRAPDVLPEGPPLNAPAGDDGVDTTADVPAVAVLGVLIALCAALYLTGRRA